MVRGLWGCQVNNTIDVKLGDADADTYKYEPMPAILDRWEKIKKDKHGKHCHHQRIFFVVCYLSGRNAREESPSSAISIESIHGR